MPGVKGFGQIPDLSFRTLCCKGKMVIDQKCDLTVRNAKVMENIKVKNDLIINGTLRSDNDKLTLGNTVIQGTMYSAQDEFTQMFTFAGNSNVTIDVIERPSMLFSPSSLMIVSPPCSGNIESIDPMTGDVVYCPQSEPTKMDIYQYRIDDICGINHLVTQIICQRTN